jgi:hypothetical protein
LAVVDGGEVVLSLEARVEVHVGGESGAAGEVELAPVAGGDQPLLADSSPVAGAVAVAGDFGAAACGFGGGVRLCVLGAAAAVTWTAAWFAW